MLSSGGREGYSVPDQSDTTNVLIEQYLEYIRYRHSRSESTINTYRSTLRFFSVFVKNCPVSELTVQMVDDYATSLIPFNFTQKTYRNRLTPIRSFFKYLYAKDITDIKPERIDLPSEGKVEANFLEPHEQELILDACNDVREFALIQFLITSGVRVSELVNARVSDLHDRSLVIRNGKGGKPRVTFITPEASRSLKLYHRSIPDQTYLFPNYKGGQLSRQYVARLVSKIAARAKIKKDVSPHTLRHTFATNLLRAGARVEDVQPMMGHANIKSTLIYMHFTNDYLHTRYDEAMKKGPIEIKAY